MFEYQHRQVVSPRVVVALVIGILLGGAVAISINFRGGNDWAGMPTISRIVHAANR